MIKTKIVHMPIRVPIGKYCWDYSNHSICERFDNEGGHNFCTLLNRSLERDDGGVLKCDPCAIDFREQSALRGTSFDALSEPT